MLCITEAHGKGIEKWEKAKRNTKKRVSAEYVLYKSTIFVENMRCYKLSLKSEYDF